MTLDRVKKGQQVKILSIPDNTVRDKALRFGITEDVLIYCDEVIPGGPTVIRRNKQQLALGRNLAGQINVSATNIPERSND